MRFNVGDVCDPNAVRGFDIELTIQSCLTSAPVVQIALLDKRVFLAYRNHRGVEDETDNWNTQKPWREAGQ